MIGVYRCLPFKKGGYTSGAFRTVVIANNVVLMSKEVAPHFTAKDVTQIKRFCRKRKYVCIWYSSVANVLNLLPGQPYRVID